jgi:lysine N6-hydroxylase
VSGRELYDVAGIGAGPFNLSLAALLHPYPSIRSAFFDRAPEFRWHAGMLLRDATVQVSFLKDLVTPVDPTSRFSFLNYLRCEKRFYRFLTAGFDFVPRLEFDHYYRWVAARLPSVHFGLGVREVSCDGSQFIITTARGECAARNVVLGTGLAPAVPTCALPHLGAHVFHSSRYLARPHRFAGLRVAVVGGGQSGAEIVRDLLDHPSGRPAELSWISHSLSFLPLDDSPFANEWFLPAYAGHFATLSDTRRRALLREQHLASNGISLHLLQEIYRRLYTLEVLEDGRRACALLPLNRLETITRSGETFELGLVDADRNERRCVAADVVILCTGFRYTFPECLIPLRFDIAWSEDGFQVRDDYSIVWNGPEACRIFVQNAAHVARGIADPNLSLMAWRSARILNAIAGRSVYDIDGEDAAITWPAEQALEEQR